MNQEDYLSFGFMGVTVFTALFFLFVCKHK